MFIGFVKIIYCDLTCCKLVELSILFLSVFNVYEMPANENENTVCFCEISLSFVSQVFLMKGS